MISKLPPSRIVPLKSDPDGKSPSSATAVPEKVPSSLWPFASTIPGRGQYFSMAKIFVPFSKIHTAA